MNKGFAYNIRVLLKAFGNYKRHIFVLFVLGFVASFVAGIGVGAIIPLFSFLLGSPAEESDFISGAIAKIFSFLPFEYNVFSLVIFVVFLFLARAILLFIFANVQVRISYDYRVRTTREVFQKLLGAGWPYLLRQRLGHVQNTILQEIHSSSRHMEAIAQVMLSFLSALVFFGFALSISPQITGFTFLAGGILLILYQPLIRKTKEVENKLNTHNKTVGHFIAEHMLGMKSVKSLGSEDKVVSRANPLFEQWREIGIKKTYLRGLSSYSIEPISIIFISLAFYFSYDAPGFNIQTFAATIYLVQRFFSYLQAGQSALHTMNEMASYTAHVVEFREKIKEYKEVDRNKAPFKFASELRFENVGLLYEEGKTVLVGLDFMLRKGEMMGLIGSSGSGKTSIADLIMRLFEPTQGKITLDGVDAKNINLHEWRSRIGYVSQDIFLFNDTIENNIKFYNEELSQDEIIKAAKKANIYGFIAGLKDGFQTLVGERGVLLSAGQRQRIVLARVLARSPEIVILDEATSALDNESETLIQKALEDLRGKITVFIIAHRISTVVDADRILVLNEGKIIEEGRPRDLLQRPDSYFYRMYHLKEAAI